MSVGVGSIHSPKEFEGLAHFLEHMLFLGTTKYPDASDYSNYLS
jgi:protease-3